ncbi:MAG TPA: YbaK/EbsC family protein [Bacteroidota bacterium]|nr:YbaK/EbsC family protein [Bacteroidota bacterium]
MVLKRLMDYLDQNGVKYVVIHHSQAFTAREVAVSAHIPGKEVAKTVIVKVDGKPTMVVLPASQMIDMSMLRKALGASSVVLATESEFNNLFPECEVGAMPPFGNLFNMDVIVADTLQADEQIAFNGGTHRELVRMAYKDFEQLVKPRILKFTVERKVRADLYDEGIS